MITARTALVSVLLLHAAGAHAQAEHLVDLVVLGGQEDHRHVGFLAQAVQQLHAVHAWHFDVQDGEIFLSVKAPELPLLESMLNA